MSYESVKRWRDKSPQNKAYNTNFMRKRRKLYRSMHQKGEIAFTDIPKSYRW